MPCTHNIALSTAPSFLSSSNLSATSNHLMKDVHIRCSRDNVDRWVNLPNVAPPSPQTRNRIGAIMVVTVTVKGMLIGMAHCGSKRVHKLLVWKFLPLLPTIQLMTHKKSSPSIRICTCTSYRCHFYSNKCIAVAYLTARPDWSLLVGVQTY